MSELLDTADAEAPAADRASRSAVPPIGATDAERLMRFWRRRDQAAFEELIEHHGPMVWGVCSQVLRRREDVEDAFQATFLILARKARTIRAADSVAGWLYRVAFRTALLAHNRRLRLAETPLAYEPMDRADDQLEAIARNEQCRVLLEELHALPLQYREPLVLCYLEGRSRSEAADELGVTPQSVKGRLARGTRLLRSRMVSRGAVLSTTMAVVAASMASAQAAAPPALVSSTAALGASFAMKLAGAGAKAAAAKAAAAVLAEKGMLSMTLVAAAKPAVAVLGVCLAAGMFAVATADGPGGEGISGGAAITLLAGSDEAGGVLSLEGDEVEVSVTADEEQSDEPQADAASAAPVTTSPQPAPVPVVAGFPAPPTAAAPADPAVPAKPPAPGGRPTEPADKFVFATSEMVAQPVAAAFAAAGDPSSFNIRVPAPTQPMAMSLPRFQLGGGSSEAALKLEQEYWTLKANALKMKAEAIMSKANALEESGAGSRTELLEARADAELALAEVKLCELNSLKVGEQLDAAEAGKLKLGSKGIQVRILQQNLNDRIEPSPKLDVDGDFGPLTEKAVKSFQKANELDETGVVDDKAAMALGLVPAPVADMLQPTRPQFDILKEAPLELRQRIQAELPSNEPRPAKVVFGGGAGGATVKAGWSAEPKVRVQIEKATAAAKEAVAKQAVAAQRAAKETGAAERAARQAEGEALRAQAEAMRSAIQQLEKQLEEAQRQAEEVERRADVEKSR